jgi:hypothetical protein
MRKLKVKPLLQQEAVSLNIYNFPFVFGTTLIPTFNKACAEYFVLS